MEYARGYFYALHIRGTMMESTRTMTRNGERERESARAVEGYLL